MGQRVAATAGGPGGALGVSPLGSQCRPFNNYVMAGDPKGEDPGFKNPFVISWASQSRVNPTANHRLTLDLWLAKDNRFLNPKSSYKRILMAPPCRLIQNQLTTIVVPVFDWQLILMESRPWSPGTWGCHHPFVGARAPEVGSMKDP